MKMREVVKDGDTALSLFAGMQPGGVTVSEANSSADEGEESTENDELDAQ